MRSQSLFQGRRKGYSRYSDRCTEFMLNFVGLGKIILICRSHEESRRVLKLYSLSQLASTKQSMMLESYQTFAGFLDFL